MNYKIFIAIMIFFVWICIGTISFYYIENWSLIDSFYFSVTTLTTVGYGDMMPSSELSRLFTAFYILFGVTSVIGGSMAVIGTHTINKSNKRIKKGIKKRNKKPIRK